MPQYSIKNSCQRCHAVYTDCVCVFRPRSETDSCWSVFICLFAFTHLFTHCKLWLGFICPGCGVMLVVVWGAGVHDWRGVLEPIRHAVHHSIGPRGALGGTLALFWPIAQVNVKWGGGVWEQKGLLIDIPFGLNRNVAKKKKSCTHGCCPIARDECAVPNGRQVRCRPRCQSPSQPKCNTRLERKTQ